MAKSLPGYELRPQQQKMAEEVQKAIDSKKHLMVEAGTGVGKSLAYLIPFIYHSINDKKRIVISTYSKTLQEQLVNKDLPFLKESLGVNFAFALCVGSENYLCLRRLKQIYQFGLFDTPSEVKEINHIFDWHKITESGLKLDLDIEIGHATWSKVCREPDICFGNKCKFISDCFFNKARALQAKSNLLVVNHHLFFSNIASAGKVLPRHDAVVFDEAHNIEDIATEYLGMEISNGGLRYLLDLICNREKEKGIVFRIQGIKSEIKARIFNSIDKLHLLSNRYFAAILDEIGIEKRSKRIRTNHMFPNIMDESLDEFCSELKICAEDISDEEDALEMGAYADRILGIKNGLQVFTQQPFEDYVYWVDIIKKTRHVNVSVHFAPVNIAEKLKEEVFDKTSPVILTSATLSTNRNFEYIKERLGMINCEELLLGSPFDFKKQSLLFTTFELSDPSYESAKFEKEAIEKIFDIVNILKGRTFVLFTNYKTLNETARYLHEKTQDLEILKQGESSKWHMLDAFKKSSNSVLLGVNTFWQGVDIPGKALECVIIFKLPFAVPDDPVKEAKMEYLAQQGKDPFVHYQIPQAIIMLKQGFGRLIRSKKDRGVVAILDPRINTRYYGRLFIESLPECTVTNDVNKIKEFFDEF